jgi:hypothetical protein
MVSKEDILAILSALDLYAIQISPKIDSILEFLPDYMNCLQSIKNNDYKVANQNEYYVLGIAIELALRLADVSSFESIIENHKQWAKRRNN